MLHFHSKKRYIKTEKPIFSYRFTRSVEDIASNKDL